MESIAEDSKVRILIVDDDVPSCLFVAKFLNQRNYIVSMASNGRDGIKRVASDSSIAVVLLDISMPGMGGMEVLRQMVSRSHHPAVIMTTGVADYEVAKQAVKIGASDYIVKPLDLTLLESSITSCLRHAEYREQSWWRRLAR